MNAIPLSAPAPAVESLSVIMYQQQPVVTTELLAKLYGTDTDNIRKNFSNNADRFVDGKHFIKLEGDALRDFKHSVNNVHSVEIPRQTRNLMLWTERGAARHAKMLDTEQAWEVFEKLEDCYFKTQPPTAPAGSIPAEQAELLRRIILERFGRRYGSVCGAMHRYFKVPNLSSLPASRFNEAREFILTFPLPPAPIPRLKKPALPVAESAPESQNARWVTFFDGHHAPTVLPFHCAGGTDTRWQLIFTRFNGLHVEQLPPRAFFADPATLQKLIQDPAGPIPRTLLPSIIEACVSRLR